MTGTISKMYSVRGSFVSCVNNSNIGLRNVSISSGGVISGYDFASCETVATMLLRIKWKH